ncbi:hypothetical protein Hypma_011035 [Hypsizygus marmoreus]|uniref:Uncharacterized protein n=1 Tax=Hypsizygus marmoreus TaxID=39966 RepID=A0A369JSQ3_HYPMA|nr:hypothetical protein Hypma_011035 [Hypsizygus marmoreus]
MSACVGCGFVQDFSDAQPCSDDPRRQLEALETEISRVEGLLAKLVQKRVPLKRNINRHYSPMLSLPVELCSEIFTTCFPPGRDSWESGSPLVLGQVCTAWRNLAWSMPWLWNTVFLQSSKPTSTHVELLEEWIARSHNLPLAIHLKLDVARVESMRDMTSIMDVFARCSKRWRTVDFDVPIFFPHDTYLCNLAPTQFPQLTSLSLRVGCVNTHLDMFLAAPQLHDVQLSGFPQDSFTLPWAQITHLRLCPTTVQQCLSLLGSTPNLTHCTLENITRSDVLNPSPVLAQHLQSLSVISFTHIPLSELLDALLLPAVHTLSFHVTGNTFPHWSFVSLIARSGCTLEHLALNAVRISEWQLWECLQAVPTLRVLELTDLDRVTNDTIRVLNPQNRALLGGPSPRCLLPSLRAFTYTGGMEVNMLSMAHTLYSRWMEVDEDDPILGVDKVERLCEWKFATTARVSVDADGKACVTCMEKLAREGMVMSLVTMDGKWI